MPRIKAPDGLFACELGMSVDIQGSGRVVLRIGSPEATVENVISAEVNEQTARRPAGSSQRRDRRAIDRESCHGVNLRAVDLVIADAVKHRPGALGDDNPFNGRGVGDLDVVMPERSYRPTTARASLHQFRPKLARGADYQD